MSRKKTKAPRPLETERAAERRIICAWLHQRAYMYETVARGERNQALRDALLSRAKLLREVQLGIHSDDHRGSDIELLTEPAP